MLLRFNEFERSYNEKKSKHMIFRSGNLWKIGLGKFFRFRFSRLMKLNIQTNVFGHNERDIISQQVFRLASI